MIDFNTAIQNIITKILKLNNIFNSKNILLYIDFPRNQTNIFLKNEKIINLIKIYFNKKNKNITFLSEDIIEKNKKKLGISNITNHLDTNTVILISRNNHVQYYLRSFISGRNNPYILKVELVLVKTGEIVFTQLEKFYWIK